jgi:hypothetical protein
VIRVEALCGSFLDLFSSMNRAEAREHVDDEKKKKKKRRRRQILHSHSDSDQRHPYGGLDLIEVCCFPKKW